MVRRRKHTKNMNDLDKGRWKEILASHGNGESRENVHKLPGVYTNYQVFCLRSISEIIHVLLNNLVFTPIFIGFFFKCCIIFWLYRFIINYYTNMQSNKDDHCPVIILLLLINRQICMQIGIKKIMLIHSFQFVSTIHWISSILT